MQEIAGQQTRCRINRDGFFQIEVADPHAATAERYLEQHRQVLLRHTLRRDVPAVFGALGIEAEFLESRRFELLEVLRVIQPPLRAVEQLRNRNRDVPIQVRRELGLFVRLHQNSPACNATRPSGRLIDPAATACEQRSPSPA